MNTTIGDIKEEEEIVKRESFFNMIEPSTPLLTFQLHNSEKQKVEDDMNEIARS